MRPRTLLAPVIVLVLGLGALSGCQDTQFRERIESDLTERAQGALSAAGLGAVDVELTGRDADVTAPTDTDALAAADLLGDVEGIRVATAYGPDGLASAEGDADASAGDADAAETAADAEDATPEASPSADAEATDEATSTPEPSGSPSDSDEDADDEPEREPTREERKKAQEDLVEIPNITFVTDSARLTKDGRRVVREAAQVLAEHPEVDVRIEGHTDSIGTGRHNQRLSERRADEVLDQLVERGVDRDRLTARGFGETDPLVVPRTFADLEKNRRVEFIVRD